ncbi:hypothetical protein BDY19DRAFT_75574 [Irpex rosettiformis]|uniref:Uncharacterized protein n=1 Tax=Irpex rosettiformis TaxID=378272 RepID=A0ACB8UP83_9APHY|nr:hypothetical protein BDY19DRAFT_75574 [Irpex rosettiformis]
MVVTEKKTSTAPQAKKSRCLSIFLAERGCADRVVCVLQRSLAQGARSDSHRSTGSCRPRQRVSRKRSLTLTVRKGSNSSLRIGISRKTRLEMTMQALHDSTRSVQPTPVPLPRMAIQTLSLMPAVVANATTAIVNVSTCLSTVPAVLLASLAISVSVLVPALTFPPVFTLRCTIALDTVFSLLCSNQ